MGPSFDLNLLRVLDTLLRTQGVTRSARQLGMTQSGVSRSLQRLRAHFDDPLLVRNGRHMQLTAVAEQLRVPVGRILEAASQLMIAGKGFEPATVQWAVRIAATGYVEHLLLPPLLLAVGSQAPSVDVHASSQDFENPDALLDGKLDFIVNVDGSLDGPDLVSTKLWTDSFCSVVRRGHPVVSDGLTLERFAALEHVLVSPGGTPGGVVDVALATMGLQRRVRAQVSTFMAPPALVASTDWIATVPRRIALNVANRWDLALLEPPLKLEDFTLSMFWSAHRRTDPAHSWFRALIKTASAGL